MIQLKDAGQLENFEFIRGIELTSKCKDIKCHILGYGIDINNPELNALIENEKSSGARNLKQELNT